MGVRQTIAVNILNRDTGETEAVKIKKFIDLPVELVSEIAKASIKDLKAIQLLENDIKNVISTTNQGEKPKLDQKTVDRLKDEAKSVLDENKENK